MVQWVAQELLWMKPSLDDFTSLLGLDEGCAACCQRLAMEKASRSYFQLQRDGREAKDRSSHDISVAPQVIVGRRQCPAGQAVGMRQPHTYSLTHGRRFR